MKERDEILRRINNLEKANDRVIDIIADLIKQAELSSESRAILSDWVLNLNTKVNKMNNPKYYKVCK